VEFVRLLQTQKQQKQQKHKEEQKQKKSDKLEAKTASANPSLISGANSGHQVASKECEAGE
jgi:hypothetical protein